MKRNKNNRSQPDTIASAPNQTRKPKKKKFSLSTLLIVLLLLVGIGIMLYPAVSDYYNNLHQSRVIADYNHIVDTNSKEENERLWNEAKAYNAKLAQTGCDFSLGQKDDSDPEKQEYLHTLDVSGTGIMGYIRIDKVHIDLPVYHDTTDSVLQIAVGHLAGTSLPVGGKNTHSVLTGHTGLPSARLFTDIDQLKTGDTFQIIVLDHTMTYQVEDIRTVLPDQLNTLNIEEGKDLVTLVTCTPYGINTHRLLVTGHRIPNPKKTTPSKSWKQQELETLLKAIIPIVAVIAAIIIFIVIRRRKMHKRIGENARKK